MTTSPRKAPVVESVLELIGQTPLIKLRNIAPEGAATIWGKCEHLNPGGSVKDRICLAMIEAAEASGDLEPGGTVVEPTSGNTGIGLALVCKRKGYKLVLTMPASMSLERRALLKSYGAEIVLTEPDRVMDGALEKAIEIANERGAFLPQQFENPANPDVHERETGREIVEAMEGLSIDALVSSVGTGGTVTGVGRAVKASHPDARIIAVEPETSPVLSGGEPGPSKIQGLNAGFIPGIYDATVVDEVRLVSDRAAWDMKGVVGRKEGLLIGISAGANVVIARELAIELGEGKNVITFLCDTGERYFSLGEYFE